MHLFLTCACAHKHAHNTHTQTHTVLPPVLVPTNIHYDAPLDRPQLAEEILPDNVVFPSTEPPTVFPGMFPPGPQPSPTGPQSSPTDPKPTPTPTGRLTFALSLLYVGISF